MNMQKAERNNIPVMLVFALIAAAMLSTPAFAVQCLSDVSTTTSISRATTGTSVAITVTTTGSSCTVNTLAIVSTPSLTVNDPASGQYSGFSAGTAKSFTVTAGTTGTYSYYAQGTTSDGSVTSTATPIEFISPADLTISATPSTASVTQGNTFSLTVNIQNTQSSDITTSYTINLPSGLTRNAGDPLTSSGTTISASSTKTIAITIAHTTCMTSGTIGVDIGDTTNAATVAVTGNSTCTSSSSSSSSAGGGGSSAAGGGATIKTTKAYSTGKATVSIPVISGGATEIVDLDAGETSVRKIEITVKGIARSITVVIEKSKLPLGIPVAPGTISHYISITKTNVSDENIASGKLEFRLEKSWITGNKIDESKVSLYRYTNAWQKMDTTKLSSDDTYVYYSAALPGLSLFAISAEKTPEGQAEQAQQEQQQQNQSQQEQQTNQTSQTPAAGGIDATALTTIIVALAVVAGAVYFMVIKKGKKEYSYNKGNKGK